jgi:predicted RNA-binding protein associated with RNAse of E/G family
LNNLTIHYFRPPARRDTYVQQVLHADDDVIVSLNKAAIAKPAIIDGKLALEPEAPIVWFTFPRERFDTGLFHLLDGTFTGVYADIIEPVKFITSAEIEMTDLFVDIWIAEGSKPTIQDVDELNEAVKNQWIDAKTGETALAEATRLVELYDKGLWPPAIVNEWPLSRVLDYL